MEGLHFRKKEAIKNPEEEAEFLDEEGKCDSQEILPRKLIIIITFDRAREVITRTS